MMVTDLLPTDEVLELRARVRSLMEQHVYPAEPVLAREDEESDALVERLRALVKEQGLWAPHLPPEAGGSNGSFLVYAHLNEEIGRSLWAQLVFGCQAPDAGNAEILWHFGTDDQKERWLRPRAAGAARSLFSMTEPEVSGSDPTGLRTRAVRDGEEWVIDGHKWFSSPSRTARVRRPVGSDPETSGSVIEKNERTSPAASGRSQRDFCSSVPKCQRISALPASGAWQPKMSCAQTERPISSFRCA